VHVPDLTLKTTQQDVTEPAGLIQDGGFFRFRSNTEDAWHHASM
jgi:hypothetical protein